MENIYKNINEIDKIVKKIKNNEIYDEEYFINLCTQTLNELNLITYSKDELGDLNQIIENYLKYIKK